MAETEVDPLDGLDPIVDDLLPEATPPDETNPAETVLENTPDPEPETEVEMTPPKVGDMVHFFPVGINLPEQCYAAVVTKVWSATCVNLTVFNAGNDNALRQNSVQHGDYMRDASYWLYR